MVAESHQSPHASSRDRSCCARRQLEPVDQLFRGPRAGSHSARSRRCSRCGAGSPERQLGTLQLGGGAQLHGADTGYVRASPGRVSVRVELAVERFR
jgi:hypothetical protein